MSAAWENVSNSHVGVPMPAPSPSLTSVPSVRSAGCCRASSRGKRVSVLALSFGEPWDRVPCIHPAQGCPRSPAAGDSCFSRQGCLCAIDCWPPKAASCPWHHQPQCTSRDCSRVHQIKPQAQPQASPAFAALRPCPRPFQQSSMRGAHVCRFCCRCLFGSPTAGQCRSTSH